CHLACLVESAHPRVLRGDDPAAVLCPAVAVHLVRVVVRGRPIVGELLARLDVAHSYEANLSLNPDVWVARVVAEDHAAFPFGRGEGSDEKALSNGDMCRTEGLFDVAQGGCVKDVATLDRQNPTPGDGLTREKATTMNLTLFDDGLRRAVGQIRHPSRAPLLRDRNRGRPH